MQYELSFSTKRIVQFWNCLVLDPSVNLPLDYDTKIDTKVILNLGRAFFLVGTIKIQQESDAISTIEQ